MGVAGSAEGSGGDSEDRGGGGWFTERLPWIGEQWFEGFDSSYQGYAFTIISFF